MTRPVKTRGGSDAAIAALSLDRGAAQNLTTQLTEQLRRMILSGRLAPGARLPSSRTLAQELGVSRATVSAAFDQLISEGYAESRRGARLIVSSALPDRVLQIRTAPPVRANEAFERQDALERQEAPPQPVTPFQLGAIDGALFPYEVWGRLLHRTWRSPRPQLIAPADPMGWPPLRAAIAEHLRLWRGIECHSGQIIITAGAFDAIDLIAHSLFKSGDAVFTEDPGFPPIRRALAGAGLRPTPIRVDENGFRLDPALAKRRAARGVFVTPSRQFPLGAALPLARRLELLEWANATEGFVIEDDFDSEYRYEGTPLPALTSLAGNERVVYMGSFSKVLFSSLRLGFLVAPVAQIDAFRERLRRRGPVASLLGQPPLAGFMASGAYATHIRRTRRVYLRRRNALLAASQACRDLLYVELASGGMHLVAWLTPKLAARMTDVEAAARARLAGVAVAPLTPCYARHPKRDALLLNYAGFNEATFPDAMKRLGEALR